MSAVDLYRDMILDHWRDPRKNEVLENPTHQHTLANASCGDNAAIELRIENDLISDVSIQISGCALSTASASVLAESILGKPIDEVSKLTEVDIRELLGGIEPVFARTGCLTLGLQAIQQALVD